ncbi:helicase-associated domain-containing protein [Fodinicola acaciae]|uniref:helicase-associated domain-containing protein n=1 Tax=Fodinicola acaciae TaxID=2681555 RepID=UPI0013D0FAE8|nr:helicase-associated domain-containing protein [Fodinicola acaciae]
MEQGSFAEYLAGLDEAALTEVLRRRPDVRAEPVPRGFVQLAERLSGHESLGAAMREVDRDAVTVSRAVAALGGSSKTASVARMLDAPEESVRTSVAELCARGLAWTHEGVVSLPEPLAAHWLAEIGGGRPAATIAKTAYADDLRATVAALGVDTDGLRKVELVDRLSEALTDVQALAKILAALPRSARDVLDSMRHNQGRDYYFYGAGIDKRIQPLREAGLVIKLNHGWELPQEVAATAWLADQGTALTGRPDIPVAATSPSPVHTTAVRTVTGLLDDARSRPIAALKKGGVGARERSRLAAQLAVDTEVVSLAIDVSYAAGLLGRADSGYAPTEAYAQWRDAEPARQWAELVIAWFTLELAPTSRETQDDKECPPPLPLASGAGMMRRALLRAAAGGRSVTAAGRQIDWFCPLHGYDAGQSRQKLAAAVREGEVLGIIAADTLTDGGEQLVATKDAPEQLAGRVAAAFPDAACKVIPQSDLTAVVSGQPSLAVSRLLTAAAVRETHGAASIWRFSADSVRAALDAGWTSDDLRAQLAAIADRPLPQPLDYLIADVGRQHGHVRVRSVRSCVIADEATAAEMLHTRKLAKLQLALLSPTVLASTAEPDDVLTVLRAAGFAPVAEDATGAVIVQRPDDQEAAGKASRTAIPGRARVEATELAARLLADPHGANSATTDTYRQLANLNSQLTEAELILLADALDEKHDILISYRDKNGTRSWREIQPLQLYGRWLTAWCHLRNGERDFTVANIGSVAPA